jgi:hypothetical protein
MRIVSRAALTLALALAAPSISHAQAAAAAHPSFAGNWALDPAQSEAGQMTPTRLNLKITQSANELVVDRDQATQMGESKVTLKYALDGSPSPNEIPIGGNTVKVSTVVTWEGQTPVFTSALKFGDNDVQQVDKWTLAEGGKKLLVSRSFNAGGQEMSSKLVLVKQP